jgi:hypothetical protein
MKKILLSIAAASAIAVAVPAIASAQSYGYDRGGWDHGDRAARLDQRIDISVRNGTLNRRGAVRLKTELHDTARLEARWARDGLSRSERAELDRRFDRIAAQIDYRRTYGYGYGDDRRY